MLDEMGKHAYVERITRVMLKIILEVNEVMKRLKETVSRKADDFRKI